MHMTIIHLEISEETFDDHYQLIVNHLNPTASWGFDDSGGCLFETIGPELEFVRSQNPRCVWTLVDGEDGDLYVISGFHFVNRLGYLVSTAAVPEDVDIQVHIPMD
jgi:hypothetical protein